MPPSGVNDAGRAGEGVLARWHKDTNGSLASVGALAETVYAVTTNRTISAYYDGLTITFDADFTNAGAVSLDVNAISADTLVWPDGQAVVAGDITAGAKITARHDGTNWQLVTVSSPRRMELQTEQATTSGTSVDFTGIPSWAKEITVTFVGVSTDGTSVPRLVLGDSGGFESTGYVGTVADIAAAGTTIATYSTAFDVAAAHLAADNLHGAAVFTLEDSANNTWVMSSQIRTANAVKGSTGSKSLSGVLTQFRFVTSGGTDNLDAGAMNALVKG